jgi:hypothetical protein
VSNKHDLGPIALTVVRSSSAGEENPGTATDNQLDHEDFSQLPGTSSHRKGSARNPIFIDAITIENQSKTSERNCQGYMLTFPVGMTPHSSYPYAMHDQPLPWDYEVRAGKMTLRA